jgi:bifunctional NMN adenylyltransferase/nudix hydrolase
VTMVGVVAGRFQTHKLHAAHIGIIETAITYNERVIIFVGSAKDVRNTPRNPLSFELRKQMIEEAFEDSDALIEIYPIYDTHDDTQWCEELDYLIDSITRKEDTVILYGGRDSFLDIYTGKFDLTFRYFHPDPDNDPSGTEIRKELSKNPRNSEDFRAGIVWASYDRWPITYPTVDVAIFSPDYDKILLGRKAKESKWRLIGGFAEPDSFEYETDAIREAVEEANVLVSNLIYLGSFKIDDWRYRREVDKIKTILYCGTTNDSGKAGDDIEEINWFFTGMMNQEWFLERNVMEAHQGLVRIATMYASARNFHPSNNPYGEAKGQLGED